MLFPSRCLDLSTPMFQECQKNCFEIESFKLECKISVRGHSNNTRHPKGGPGGVKYFFRKAMKKKKTEIEVDNIPCVLFVS